MTKLLPYGDRAVLVSESFVFICDKILLKADFESEDALLAEIKDIYDKDRMARDGA
jgi:hypothetical protein